MKPKSTDIQKIARRKCQTEGCPNKASSLAKRKFLCNECFNRKKHRRIMSNRVYYLDFLKNRLAHT